MALFHESSWRVDGRDAVSTSKEVVPGLSAALASIEGDRELMRLGVVGDRNVADGFYVAPRPAIARGYRG